MALSDFLTVREHLEQTATSYGKDYGSCRLTVDPNRYSQKKCVPIHRSGKLVSNGDVPTKMSKGLSRGVRIASDNATMKKRLPECQNKIRRHSLPDDRGSTARAGGHHGQGAVDHSGSAVSLTIGEGEWSQGGEGACVQNRKELHFKLNS